MAPFQSLLIMQGMQENVDIITQKLINGLKTGLLRIKHALLLI